MPSIWKCHWPNWPSAEFHFCCWLLVTVLHSMVWWIFAEMGVHSWRWRRSVLGVVGTWHVAKLCSREMGSGTGCVRHGFCPETVCFQPINSTLQPCDPAMFGKGRIIDGAGTIDDIFDTFWIFLIHLDKLHDDDCIYTVFKSTVTAGEWLCGLLGEPWLWGRCLCHCSHVAAQCGGSWAWNPCGFVLKCYAGLHDMLMNADDIAVAGFSMLFVIVIQCNIYIINIYKSLYYIQILTYLTGLEIGQQACVQAFWIGMLVAFPFFFPGYRFKLESVRSTERRPNELLGSTICAALLTFRSYQSYISSDFIWCSYGTLVLQWLFPTFPTFSNHIVNPKGSRRSPGYRFSDAAEVWAIQYWLGVIHRQVATPAQWRNHCWGTACSWSCKVKNPGSWNGTPRVKSFKPFKTMSTS